MILRSKNLFIIIYSCLCKVFPLGYIDDIIRNLITIPIIWTEIGALFSVSLSTLLDQITHRINNYYIDGQVENDISYQSIRNTETSEIEVIDHRMIIKITEGNETIQRSEKRVKYLKNNQLRGYLSIHSIIPSRSNVNIGIINLT